MLQVPRFAALRDGFPLRAVFRAASPIRMLARGLGVLFRDLDDPARRPPLWSAVDVPDEPERASPSSLAPEVHVQSFGDVYLVTMRYRGTIRATWCCARTHRRLATRTLARA